MQNRRANCGKLRILWNQATGERFSRATCHTAARKIVTYKAKEEPLLAEVQKRYRLMWAKEHKARSQAQWDSIIWNDEARFEVCVGDCRSRVIRRSLPDWLA
ncbi:hypothetical protein Trydic_g18962 [Trypoxylus dichotomus]